MKLFEPFDFSSSMALLLLCSQANPDNEKIYHYCLKIENWEDFIDLVYRNGVTPVVYLALKNTADIVPDRIMEELKRTYLSIAKENMMMSAELIRIIKIFRAQSIDVLPFKGPVLAKMAYGDITLRHYLDLDFLISKDDMVQAQELLSSLQYSPRDCNISLEKNRRFELGQDLGYINTENGIITELHWGFLSKNYPVSLDNLDFWKKKSVITISNFQINTFSEENLVFYLLIHGSKHFWERIEWLVDIDRLILNTPTLDWDYILKESKRTDTQNMLLLGIFLLHVLFNTKIPDNFFTQAVKSSDIQQMSKYITSSWDKDSPKNSLRDLVRYFTIHSKLFIKTRQRINFIFFHIFKNRKHLSGARYMRYIFTRAFYLIDKYVIRLILK